MSVTVGVGAKYFAITARARSNCSNRWGRHVTIHSLQITVRYFFTFVLSGNLGECTPLIGVIVVASLAFVGTMFDNFFAFAAQLVVTKRERFRRVSWAQALAMTNHCHNFECGRIVTFADPRSLDWRVMPRALRLRGARVVNTDSCRAKQFRRGSVTTFAITMALGGDNIAVWTPIFRSNSLGYAFLTVATFLGWELIFLFQRSATRRASPRRHVGERARAVNHARGLRLRLAY